MKAGFWQLKTVTKIFAAVLLGLAMFELAMVLLLPGIAKTQSRVISVVFASVLAAVVSGIFACRRAGLENELKKSADFYLTLLYDFPYLIWRSDVDGHYDYFNGAWLRFTGRTLEQEQGEGWLDSVHPEDRETCLHIYNEAFQRRTSFITEFRLRRYDGECRWIRGEGRPYMNLQGEFAGYIGTYFDITENKRSEERLTKIGEHYRRIIQLLPDTVLIHSGGRIVFANEEAKRLLKVDDKQDICGWSILDFIHPERREIARQRIQMVEKENVAVPRMEQKLVRTDGTIVDVDVASAPFVFNGQPAVLSVFRDITERNQTLQAIRESEQQYSSLFENNHSVMMIIDPGTGEIKQANRAACEFYGYSKEQLTKMNIAEINTFNPDQINEEMQLALKEQRKHFNFRHRLANGELRDVEVFSGPIPIKGKTLLYSIVHDVTEKRKAEELVRKLSQAVEQSPASVVITDLEGKIEYVNPKFTQVTGYSVEEAIGQNPRILKSGEWPSEAYRELWETITAGKEWRGEFHNKRKDSTLYWEYASISPIRNEKGEITHFLAVKEDITERKLAEAELARAKEAAEAANRAKDQFLANMSHEIRTPMNGIIGMTELVLATELTNEQREYLEIVKDSSESLLRLLNDLLDLSKIEAGMIELEKAPFCLEEAVKKAVEPLRHMANQKGLRLSCRIEPAIAGQVIGDRYRLAQVLTNLVGNAVKFTENGEIKVSITGKETDEDGVRMRRLQFSVADTGIGIPADKMDRLFKSFSQVDGSTTRKYEGTGLGLAICKHLVELMGGTIQVESKEGEGSTFSFTLLMPVADAPALAAQGSGERAAVKREVYPGGGQTAAIMPGKTGKILLAEDNPVNQKLVKTILDKRGWQTVVVDNGLAALAAWRSEHFDLILMDVQMPELDGVETTRRIRAEEREKERTPIVALTAHALEEDKTRCLAAGMDDYLVKPIHAEELMAMIQKWAGSRGQAQEGAQGPSAAIQSMLEVLDGDAELAGELLAAFIQDVKGKLPDLVAAIEQTDYNGLCRLAHGLKGAAGNLGLQTLFAAFAELDAMGKQENITGGARILSGIQEELKELERQVPGGGGKGDVLPDSC